MSLGGDTTVFEAFMAAPDHALLCAPRAPGPPITRSAARAAAPYPATTAMSGKHPLVRLGGEKVPVPVPPSTS
jgi:hypothetical protein